tara:strand:+ start:122 stop:406 length:285 start_codon:yes stop_codon:yes gene_type:complete
LLELRAEVRNLPNPAKFRPFLMRESAIVTRKAPTRPTRRDFLREARRLIGTRANYGSHDSEYYSACGWDDYVGEMAAEARSHGYLLRAAARVLS